MDNFIIDITGSGTTDEILNSLEEIVQTIKELKSSSPENLDDWEWENPTLNAIIFLND